MYPYNRSRICNAVIQYNICIFFGIMRIVPFNISLRYIRLALMVGQRCINVEKKRANTVYCLFECGPSNICIPILIFRRSNLINRVLQRARFNF
jgi:hypothetical protein